MKIQEAYQKIIIRIQTEANREKYHHLENSPDKSNEEQELYDNIIKLGDYISTIDNYATASCNVPLELLESKCRMLIPEICEQLNQQGWD